jgi:ribonuclease HII
MAVLAGIDEAGLGPRLGPLVIGLSVFRGERSVLERLGDALDPVVRSSARAPVPVGDSKRLFGANKNLLALERGLYPFAGHRLERIPRSLVDWVTTLDLPEGRARDRLHRYPWYRQPLALPRRLTREALQAARSDLASCLAGAGVEFVEMRVGALPAGEVNDGLRRCASKNVFNFRAAAPFLRRVFEGFARKGEPAEVVVDRQGGRKDYAALLRAEFYPVAVRPHPPKEDEFGYTVHDDERRLEIRFRTRADAQCLPVGLASMAAKYTRELHMILFNRFWRERVPDLRPTAGYPVDATRFLQDIEGTRRKAGIDPQQLVRVR